MSLRNLEAEMSVLGALLYDNRLAERLDGLAAEDFSEGAHQRIYRAAMARIRAGGVADGVSMRAQFEADGALAEIGGAVYLATLLANATPFRETAVYHAGLIVAAARRRDAAEALRDALYRIEEEEADPAAAVGAAEVALRHSVGERGGAQARIAGAELIADMDRPGLPTGLAALDARLGGLHAGDLIIVAARPSMGKTTLASQIARNVAGRGLAVHFASLEMSRQQLARRAISGATFDAPSGLDRIEYFRIRAGVPNHVKQRLAAVAESLPETWWIDDRPAQSVAMIEAGARGTRKEHGRLDLVIVDHIQIMREPGSANRLMELTTITAGLKSIAKRLNVPVLALCQLNRSVESRENKRPALADLRESGTIEQDADVVLGLYREAYYLERDPPAESASHEEYFKWEARLEKAKRDLEIVTLKQRQGPLGSDHFEAWLPFDTIKDKPPEKPTLRMVREGDE